MQVLYTAAATATGDGRSGHVRSSDGVLDHSLTVPKELGGPGGERTNPEQLFAAGYAACFHSALKTVARTQKIILSDTAITVDIGIGPNGDGGYGLTATIEAELPGLDEATALALLTQAHKVCPYSNATRGNVDVTINLA
ncbi:organic hydroperoxide resistance protein [Krasilnikovia sp. MM14-A1259]|uniref:organic hydroperoxide resistance protein n=1 Tax=Krasilnikovia sp. MM14-A1259 TaxID=3373539 RepID=UPI003825294E